MANIVLKPDMTHPEVAAEMANVKSAIESLRKAVKEHCEPGEYLTPGGDYNSRTEYGSLMLHMAYTYCILKERGY